MTNGATSRDTGAATAAPRPGSCEAAAIKALAAFAFQERAFGAIKAHDSFDGILAEHALALEEARDMFREGLRIAVGPPILSDALRYLEDQITYVRALGSVADTKGDDKDAE